MYNPVSLEEWDTYLTIDGQNTGIVIENTQIKLGGWYFYNNATGVRHIKLYDMATIPNPAQDIPKLVFTIPGGGGADAFSESGATFKNGLAIRVCTGIAHTDNTAPSTNDVLVNLFYK